MRTARAKKHVLAKGLIWTLVVSLALPSSARLTHATTMALPNLAPNLIAPRTPNNRPIQPQASQPCQVITSPIKKVMLPLVTKLFSRTTALEAEVASAPLDPTLGEIAPVTANCTLRVAEDSTATVNLQALIGTLDGRSSTVAISVQPTQGSASISPGSTNLVYTPNANFHGNDSLRYTATNTANETATGTIQIVVTPVNDPPTVSLIATPISGSVPLTVAFAAVAADIDGDVLTYAWAFGDGATGGNEAGLAHRYDTPNTYNAVVTVSDGVAQATATANITALPAGPVIEPPTVDQTVVSTFFDSTRFLYDGPNAVQTGVLSGTIDIKRVSVLRGRVLAKDGSPLPTVVITVKNHPEFGQTQSRANGEYDLAVNGGGILTLDYQKNGYLGVQRQEYAPWQNFGLLDDVVMTTLDPVINDVTLNSSTPMQVARGSTVSDEDGVRKSTLLIPQGTTGEMVLADGTTQTLPSNIRIRATEFTVGDNGPNAMPGSLPPESGYTYAVELTVDEAQTQGATDVRFNQPLYHYVENFLSFPVGISVPVGYYDRQRALWVPSQDGRVVKIVAITGGLADVDTDGDGLADNNPVLGFTDAERQKLAELYAVGVSLWRVPITHFTPWDCNWPFGPPGDATGPDGNDPNGDDRPDDPCQAVGSIIECESQVLGERKKIPGTLFNLNYRSDRTQGRSNNLDIRVSGSTVPTSLKRIDVQIEIGGKVYTREFPAAPNQSFSFGWDGRDAYSRTLQGDHPATVKVGFVYDGVYRQSGGGGNSFGRPSGVAIEGSRTRQEVTLLTTRNERVGNWDAAAQGMGGWSIDVHHVYDPIGLTLYEGNGKRRSVQSINAVMTTIAGGGSNESDGIGDGGPATEAVLSSPRGVTIGPDGSLYISERYGHRVRIVSPTGVITTLAGTGTAGYNSNDIPAYQARLYEPDDTALGLDGSLYIADAENNRIRRVGLDGIITTVVGTGVAGFSGDGGPAAQAQLNNPQDVVFGADGTLYIADKLNNRIRRVGPDGIITTIAGTSTAGFSGDNGPAIAAQLNRPDGVTLGPDGSIYLVEDGNNRVRRIFPDGTIRTVAGTGSASSSGDGGPATLASLYHPSDIIVGLDGSMYVIEEGNRLRFIAPDGVISTLAGNGSAGYSGEGLPGPASRLNSPDGIALGPDGAVYIADIDNDRIRKLSPPLPGFNGGDIAIPSDDGLELFQFTSAGRHVRTYNALTGAVRYQFEYDANGRLARITDGDANLTTIERNAQGQATGILGPYGQRTTLSVGGNGYLASFTNSANEVTLFEYDSGGLMTRMTDPRGNTSTFTYDSQGRLLRDQNAVGGFTALARVGAADGYTVTKTNALGHNTTFNFRRLPAGGQQRVIVAPNGGRTTLVSGADGSTTRTDPRGVVTVVSLKPDPRWGMQAPYVGSLTRRTGSSAPFQTVTSTRVVELTDPTNPLSLLSLTDVAGENGRITRMSYHAPNRTMTTTTPSGETTVTTVDGQGRPVRVQTSNMAELAYSYDSRGRLIEMREGSGAEQRVTSYTYDAQGYLASMTDALGGITRYTYDAVGRMRTQTLPTGQVIEMSYDAAGNLISYKNEQGVTTTYEYDAYNRKVAETLDPSGRAVRTEWTYDLANNATQLVEDAGAGKLNVTTRTAFVPFDAADHYLVLSQTNALNQTTVLSYNTSGDVVNVTDPLNHRTTFVYSGQGWRTRVTTPRGDSTNTEYNNDGQITRVTDARNVRTQFEYDLAMRLKRVVVGTLAVSGAPALNLTTIYTHDVNGRPVLLQDPRGNLSSRSYDAYGNVISQTDGVGNVTTFVYDKLDRVVQRTVGSNAPTEAVTTAWAYDAIGRMTQEVQDPAGLNLITRFNYARQGSSDTWNLQEVVTPRGHSTFYSFNSLRTLASVTDANSQTWSLGYDNLGRPTQQTDPLNRVTTMSVDALGRITSLTRAGRTEQWVYNADGTQASYTSFATSPTLYIYDNDKRLTGINYPAPMADVTFVYDASNNVTRVTDGLGQTQYTYDAGNRMTSRLRGGRTISYTYDANSNLTGLGYWGQGVVQMGYDAANRATSLDAWGSLTSTYTYRSSNLLASQSRTNGVSSQLGYDSAGRLTQIAHARGATPLNSINYLLDANGNRTQMQDVDGTSSYAYDALDRLTGASYPAIAGGPAASSAAFTFDMVGNRLSDGVTSLTYDGDDRISTAGFTYDTNGNLTSDGATTYEYDAANRLTRTVKGGIATTYGYDGWSNLVRVSTQGITTELMLDERTALPRVLGEVRSNGSETHYTFGPEGVTAQRDVLSGTTPTVYTPLVDGLGSVRMLADAAGSVVLQRSFDAYGNVRHSTGSANSSLGFAGEWTNPTDGTVYLRARHYQPALGRFLQRDSFPGVPMRPQSLNRYAYAENNPVRFTDPSGHFLDTLLDVGFILYDLYRIVKDNIINGCDNLGENLAALGLDVAGALIPFATGLGAAGRAARHADDILDAAKYADDAADAARGADKASDATKAADNADDAVDYSRPSGYRKGVRDEVWENAKGPDGQVRDPLTNQVMDKNQPWDMGHKPGHEFRKHQQSAEERGISRKEFLDEHNNPNHYRPELPSSNRSHRGEDMTDGYSGP